MEHLSDIDRKNIWHPFTPLQGSEDPLLLASASGVYLHTPEGRKIIDAISSWWVNIHGHAHPYIADALAKQARTLEHVIFAGFTHEPAITLSKNLKSILPGNQEKIFFSDNGSTAVEVALKMAFQYWHNRGIEKKNIIAIQGAYHGDTFGAMSVGERGIFTNPFSKYLFDTLYIDFPEAGLEERSFEQLKAHIARNDVGAFIFEPLVQGAAGMRIYGAPILDQMIEFAQKNDVICIADEVFTGFGRTGKIFAIDFLNRQPDIICLSKGLTGGTLPLGVTSCSEKIVSAFKTNDFLKTFFHGHSYTANPLCCAAANASFELLMRNECQQNIERISLQQRDFTVRLKGHPKLRSIKSQGTILALEIKTKDETGYASEARKNIYNYFLEKNILLRPLGNVVYVLPPFIISEQELNFIHSTIIDYLEECN
jgi:adenosylmethionine---8-amino-7-oxononanoate aminotransferase